MNTNEQSTLLFILGFTDGTLEPVPLTGDSWQADMQVRAAYRDTGALTISNPGEDGAARKRFLRGVESLEADGLVLRRGKRIGLTASGDAAARHLAGLPTIDDAADLLAAITKPDRRHRWSDGSISESSLCGREPLPAGKIGSERTPVALASILMQHLAPLVASRLVDSRPLVGFAGVLLLKATDPVVDHSEPLPAGTAAKWFRAIKSRKPITPQEAYSEGWLRAYAGREHAKPERPCLVHHLDVVDPPPSGTSNRNHWNIPRV